MELKEMIKVMQHFENGGEVEFKKTTEDDKEWLLAHPTWNWASFDYRIKKEKRVVIEKWLCKDKEGEYVIIDSSNVDKYKTHTKVKLMEIYEVEI